MMDSKKKTIRRNINIASIVLALLALFLLLRNVFNGFYIQQLDQGNYDSSLEKALYYPNFPESYVPRYNEGIAAYEKGEYYEAASQFQQALNQFPLHPKECLIRINYALSLLQQIDFDHLDNETKVENAINTLYAARDILTEEKCASDENDYHNDDAEQLKEDIDKLLEALQSSSSGDSSDDSPESSDSQNNQNSMSHYEENLQQQLHNQMHDAMETQQEARDDYENSQQEIDYSLDTPNW